MSGAAGAHSAGARVLIPRRVLTGTASLLGAGVRAATPVGGGCVSPAFRVDLADGRTCFVKAAPAGAAPDLLHREAEALDRIGAAGVVRVPAVLGVGAGVLALEWLEPGVPPAGAWAELGRCLAVLHGMRAAAPGLEADNYIGPLPQANAAMDSWADFWAERRLGPQLDRAAGSLPPRVLAGFEQLLVRLPELLAPAEEEGASLLHGDLWSGNVHMTAAGAALVDPSSYFGHREVDLAMAALFGGFGPGFEAAYAGEWPLLHGWRRRRAVYQLYYLLVHVNLFGGSYAGATERTLAEALS
jgi:protein-ribulosamine 3-kinase